MPTYYIRLGESQERDALVSNLIGTLEKLYGIVTYDAIGVVLDINDPAGDLIRSLAQDVIPNRPTFKEILASAGEHPQERVVYEREGREVFFPLPGTSVGVVAVAPGTEVPLNSGMVVKAPTTNTGTVYVGEPSQALMTADDKRKIPCDVCGTPFVPKRKDSKRCSVACNQKAYARAHIGETGKNGRKKRKASGGLNDGSGLKYGKLVGGG